MPKFSLFTRFSHLRFSARAADAELIYQDRIENYGNGRNFDDAPGTAFGAKQYAKAMSAARAKLTNLRAENQAFPKYAREMLPLHESQYGLIPAPTATVKQRQTEVAAEEKIARGASQSNVEAVLRELLGEDFIAYVPMPLSGAVSSTNAPASVGVWDRPGTPKSVWKTVDPVSILNVPRTITIVHVAGDAGPLKIGQRVALDVGNDTRAEAVDVSAATTTSITAVFRKPHDVGTAIASGRVPNMSGTKRTNLVVLSAAAMADREKRRKANRVLRKVLRGVSWWKLAQPSGAETTGPFVIGTSMIGRDTVAARSF